MTPSKRTRLDYALNYYDKAGFICVPTCWVDDKGNCACFHKHTGKQVGKAPLVSYNNEKIDRGTIIRWFSRFPFANIGVLLESSGLVVVDADSPDAVAEVETLLEGINTAIVDTNRGKHYYFRQGDHTPLYKTTQKGKSKAIDIMSTGLITVPPSIHREGHLYKWNPTPKQMQIPIVPGVIDDLLLQAKKKHQRVNLEDTYYKVLEEDITESDLNLLPLSEQIKDIILHAESSKYYRERGYQSRSEAIYSIMISCALVGLSDEVICSLLMNPKHAISKKVYEKSGGVKSKMIEWLTKTQLPKARLKAKKSKKRANSMTLISFKEKKC